LFIRLIDSITVIQGTADAKHEDVKAKLTQEEISKTVEFALKSWLTIDPEQKEALVQKLKSFDIHDGEADDPETIKALNEVQKQLAPEESQVLNILRGRKMMRHEDMLNVDNFTKDAFDGHVAVLEKGNLGLKKVDAAKVPRSKLFSLGFLEGHGPDQDKMMTYKGDNTGKINEDANGHSEVANGTEITANGSNGHTNGHTNGANGANGTNGASNSNGSSKTSDTGFNKLLHPVLGEGQSLDESSRHFLINTFHEAAEKLETPHDTMRRLADTVCHHLQKPSFLKWDNC
jgi:hypothetical protein